MTMDQQRAEWEAFEEKELARRVCPYSGEELKLRKYDDGPVDATGAILSCTMCDCFGFAKDDPRVGQS